MKRIFALAILSLVIVIGELLCWRPIRGPRSRTPVALIIKRRERTMKRFIAIASLGFALTAGATGLLIVNAESVLACTTGSNC
jgi:hypothetical protein